MLTSYASGTPVASGRNAAGRSPSGNACNLSSSSWPYRFPLGMPRTRPSVSPAGWAAQPILLYLTARRFRSTLGRRCGRTRRPLGAYAVCWPSLGGWAPMDGCFERTPPSAFWAEMITQSDAPAFTFLLHLPSLNFGRWTCTHPCEAPDPVDGLPILFCQPTPRSASTLDNLTLGAYAWALSAVPYSFVGVTWLTGRCDQALKPRLTMPQQFQNPAPAPFPT